MTTAEDMRAPSQSSSAAFKVADTPFLLSIRILKPRDPALMPRHTLCQTPINEKARPKADCG